MTAPLALPPAGGISAGPARPRNLLNIGVLVVVCGGVALFGSLIGAYVSIGHLAPASAWPPHGFAVDDYVGNMLAITSIMSAATVEWAWYAIKREDPAQASWGLGLTAGFACSFVLLLWQLGHKAGFGPGTAKYGAYAVLFYALIVAAGAFALAGVVVLLMALARVLGRQMTPANCEMVRAVAWYWDFVVVAWIAVFATLWLFT